MRGVRIGWPTLANRTAPGECAGPRIRGRRPPAGRHGRTGVPSGCDDSAVTANKVTAQDEVVDICRDLIRIDTSNPGDHSGPGERQAAEHVAGLLSEVGLEPVVLESHPKRTSVVARISGRDSSRTGLLVHGHLDVVPASAADWQVGPFSGEVADGCVWGRGAIDMKDMDAMMLAVVRQRLREGRAPARDIVLAFEAKKKTWTRGAPPWCGSGCARAARPPATSCSRSPPTRRRGAPGAPAGWWTTTLACSKAPPKRSARSAASA